MKNEIFTIPGLPLGQKCHMGLTVLALCICQLVFAQDITVSGVVSDEDGTPLIGATVLVEGTGSGTITDYEGKYSISAPADATLQFSYTGYNLREIPVAGQSTIDVVLTSGLLLDEVVVVGYGTMERANVTGSIVTVDVEELEKVPVPNVVEGLRAQVPGLRVTRGSGQPGSGITFKIRGTNSLGAAAGDIDATNTPIIVIDGVPIVGGNLAELNPDDIASINILKDAAAASIYGSSGANGAILITTKNGKAGESKISLSASTGFVDVANRIPMMNGGEYIQYRIDSEKAVGVENPSINALVDPSEAANYIAGKDVDWQDQLLRTGMQTRIGLSASGGNPWDTQLAADAVPLVFGDQYEIRLWAKAAGEGAVMRVSVSRWNNSNGDDYFYGGDVNLTQEWAEYSWEFTVGKDIPTGHHIVLDMGASAQIFFVDDVVLYEIPEFICP